MQNKKILILGGSGFVGKNLLSKINQNENSVSIVSRKKIFSKYKVIVGNLINDHEKIKKSFFDFDIIFNCSGELKDQEKMKKLHVDALSKIASFLSSECLKKKKKIRWIQLSSIGIFGFNRKKEDIDENSLKDPSNNYEKTKLASEEIIINSANEFFEYVILRPSTIYGIGMKSDFIFRLSRYIKKNFFFYIGSKESLFNLIHIDDVSDALLMCARDNVQNEIFNLSCNYKLNEIIKIICSYNKIKEPKIVLNEKVVRFLVKFIEKFVNVSLNQRIIDILVSQRNFKMDKIKNSLGFKPKINLYDGLNEVLRKE